MNEQVERALADHPLLGRLGADAQRRVAAAAHLRRLSRGQVLFVTGEPSESLFVVVSGRLRVYASSPRGDEVIFGLVGPGDSVGELTMLDGGARSADVDAVESSTLVSVPSSLVRDLLREHPEVLFDLAASLAADVRRLSGRTTDLVFLDLRRRVAKLLLDDAGERDVVELALSQSGVAARVGATRQSLNRALAELVRRGWIGTDGQRVTLLDRESLARFVDS